MKKCIILLIVLLIVFFSGCGNSKNVNIDKAKNTQLSELEIARSKVIDNFKNERDVIGTGKFMEDMYKKYPDDETISAIYNYSNAKFCYDTYLDYKNNPVEGLDGTEWLNKAKSYASKISPEYDGEFSVEIISYVSELLGDDWSKLKKENLKQGEKYNNLSMEEKKEIKRFIESRYEYYDKQEGGSSEDKYSNVIWQEASEKFGLSEDGISNIWEDLDVNTATGRENTQENIISYDAVLSFQNGSSIIAIDEESLDAFMDALAKGNSGTINELYNSNKISEVPKGTHVNIIKTKMTRVKVKILDGLYKDNEVWVLIESIQK